MRAMPEWLTRSGGANVLLALPAFSFVQRYRFFDPSLLRGGRR